MSTPKRTLLTVCQGECRFIIGEPHGAETFFCGDPTVKGSYCAEHAAKMFIEVSDEEVDQMTEYHRRWSPILRKWIADGKKHRRIPDRYDKRRRHTPTKS